MKPGSWVRPTARRLVRFATFLALGIFGWLLVQEIREGLLPEEVGVIGESIEETEEVQSSGIRLLQVDERGEPVAEIRAEESVAAAGSDRRFLSVSVRFIETHGEEDTIVEADELILDMRRETFRFLGHVRFSTTDLELAGPHLQFRRNPDRMWATDPMLFRAGEFHGVAKSLDFRPHSGILRLVGMTAANLEEGGLETTAERARFDHAEGNILFSGDVEMRSPRFLLLSARSVELQKDPETGRFTGLRSGFDTILEVMAESGPEIALTVRGDQVEMELSRRRQPRRIRVSEGARLSDAQDGEARGETAEIRFDAAGKPASLTLLGDARTRVVTEGSEQLIQAEAEVATIRFNDEGALNRAQYQGDVEVRYRAATAFAEGAEWDGAAVLSLSGSPRVEDRTLLELTGGDLKVELGEPGRILGRGGVVGRLVAGRADWLPGAPDGVSLSGERAEIETGTGRANFEGAVRMLFGDSRIAGDSLRLDAPARVFAVDGGVDTRMRFVGEDAGDFAFSTRSETLRYGSTGLEYRGDPALEHFTEEIESRLLARTILAEIQDNRKVSALIGNGDARFERDANRVTGNRIRLDPEADVLRAFGNPAVVELGSRRSEGGTIQLALGEDRWDILPGPARRTTTTVQVKRER